jgi:hypothetical protein
MALINSKSFKWHLVRAKGCTDHHENAQLSRLRTGSNCYFHVFGGYENNVKESLSELKLRFVTDVESMT